jgi:hypothetical protein
MATVGAARHSGAASPGRAVPGDAVLPRAVLLAVRRRGRGHHRHRAADPGSAGILRYAGLAVSAEQQERGVAGTLNLYRNTVRPSVAALAASPTAPPTFASLMNPMARLPGSA